MRERRQEEEGEAGEGGIGLGGRRNIMCVFRICALCAIYELTFLNEVNSQQRGRQRERERVWGGKKEMQETRQILTNVGRHM